MGMLIHLVQVLVAACIAYVGILILGVAIGIVLILWAIHKLTAYAVSKALWGLLFAALLITTCQRTVYASSVHVSRKAYVKESTEMLHQYNLELVQYVLDVHPGVSEVAVNLYEQRALWDIDLAGAALEMYRRHKYTQDDVDAALNQLSRDMEDIPPSMASSTDLKN